ncbi:hypothetical protein Stsp01_65810 [Streptomyces sp. NBRC 13847]|nr:hypothetical protein Stsp01_65810 [Streptomyces sp. NBRC 13847]
MIVNGPRASGPSRVCRLPLSWQAPLLIGSQPEAALDGPGADGEKTKRRGNETTLLTGFVGSLPT